MLVSKIIFFKKIILIYFQEKNTLKSNNYHILTYPCKLLVCVMIFIWSRVFLFLCFENNCFLKNLNFYFLK